MDIFAAEKRSQIMSSVKSRNNKSTEIKFINLLRQNSISGWRRRYPVNGKPDFVFLKSRLAVFVDGCFWHGHDCRNTKPKQNKTYWELKIERNKTRDKIVTELFLTRGWRVLRIWECELKKNPEEILDKLRKLL